MFIDWKTFPFGQELWMAFFTLPNLSQWLKMTRLGQIIAYGVRLSHAPQKYYLFSFLVDKISQP